MENIFKEKLNEYLTGFIEYKWEEFIASKDLIGMSLEQLELMKVSFHLGYQQGYEDNFQELKEAYKNDWILLVDIFEDR